MVCQTFEGDIQLVQNAVPATKLAELETAPHGAASASISGGDAYRSATSKVSNGPPLDTSEALQQTCSHIQEADTNTMPLNEEESANEAKLVQLRARAAARLAEARSSTSPALQPPLLLVTDEVYFHASESLDEHDCDDYGRCAKCIADAVVDGRMTTPPPQFYERIKDGMKEGVDRIKDRLRCKPDGCKPRRCFQSTCTSCGRELPVLRRSL